MNDACVLQAQATFRSFYLVVKLIRVPVCERVHAWGFRENRPGGL